MSSFERLLARVLRQPVPATTPCPTAETLAAYLEHGLTRAEHAAVEGHASTCARCAAHLAALVHLADRLDGPVAPAPAWWRRHLWVVPAAGLAVTLVVWTSIPKARISELTRPAPTSVAAPAPTVASKTIDETTPPMRTGGTAALEIAPKVPTTPAAAALQESAGSASAAKPLRQREALADKDARFEPQSKTAPRESAAAGAAPDRPASESERDTVDQLSRADAAPRANEMVPPSREPAGATSEARPQATAAAPSAPAEVKKEQARDAKASDRPAQLAAPAAAPPAPLTSSADAGLGASGARVEGRLKAAALPPLAISAPGGRTVWRITVGRIERSTDGGSTWTMERSPALAAPVAGSAPATDTCWVVDAHGLILRRDSSGRWQTLATPATNGALTGIEARSATDATLTAATGQRYATTDGGVTWRPLPR